MATEKGGSARFSPSILRHSYARLGTHLLTDKHKNGVLRRKSEFDSRRTMTSWLRKFREKNRCLHGDTVSDIQDQYRLRVTRALMSAGIPLNKLERSESFWATNYIDFPALTELVRYAWTSTSSSGSVERLFSVLKRTFTTQQLASAYIDYVEASCMLQFNKEFIIHFCDFLP